MTPLKTSSDIPTLQHSITWNEQPLLSNTPLTVNTAHSSDKNKNFQKDKTSPTNKKNITTPQKLHNMQQKSQFTKPQTYIIL